MAYDKLVDSTQLNADLTSVANAIRTKGGTSAQLAFPAGFVTAIGNISGGGGGSATLIEKSITANGTYNASSDNADGYSKVVANVPNSYAAGDEGKVVSNGALVSQTSDTVTTNDTYDTTLINSLTVNVSGASLPLLIAQEDITIAEDLTSYTTNQFQNTYLPNMSRPYRSIIYLIENTNTDTSYSAQAACRLSTLSNDYVNATTRVFVRSSGATTAGNSYFYIGAGSVMHKYVFGVASS